MQRLRISFDCKVADITGIEMNPDPFRDPDSMIKQTMLTCYNSSIEAADTASSMRPYKVSRIQKCSQRN